MKASNLRKPLPVLADEPVEMNYGRLREKLPLQKNIVYFKRGDDEMSLNITNRCPNRCPFCIRDHDAGWGKSNLYLSGEPTIDEVVEAADEALSSLRLSGELPLKKVKICGYGEPVLRLEDIPTMVERIEKSNAGDIGLWQLTTTGWPIYHSETAGFENAQPLLRDLRTSGVKQINLSLHAISPENYARLVKPPIDPTLAFILALRFADDCLAVGFDVTMVFMRVKSLPEREAQEFAESRGCSYRLLEYQ